MVPDSEMPRKCFKGNSLFSTFIVFPNEEHVIFPVVENNDLKLLCCLLCFKVLIIVLILKLVVNCYFTDRKRYIRETKKHSRALHFVLVP